MGRQPHVSQFQCQSPSQNHPLHSQRCLCRSHTLFLFSAVGSSVLSFCTSALLLVFSSCLLLNLFLLAHLLEEPYWLLNFAHWVLSLMSSPLFHLLSQFVSHLCCVSYFVVCPELCPATSSVIAFLIP